MAIMLYAKEVAIGPGTDTGGVQIQARRTDLGGASRGQLFLSFQREAGISRETLQE
jgi:hypothetical protein